MANAERLPPEAVQARIAALWNTLERDGSVMWTMAQSPAFPDTWPPTGQTAWMRYAYAQGMAPGLSDGVRVSAAWACVTQRPSEADAEVSVLRTRLEPVGTQGVFPLRADALAALNTRGAVEAAVVALTAMPEGSDAAAIRAFYREWLRANGAFAATIKAAHVAFFAWLAS